MQDHDRQPGVGDGAGPGSDRDTPAVTPVRAPRMATLVADVLRQQIVSGELADGAQLPKEEQLRDRFQVGKPAMREALRILETEGLIAVMRGNRGGAVVHAPQVSNSAYGLGIVLAARGVSARDVGIALRQIEPVCAALCASRDDRHREVVPALTEIHQRITEDLRSPDAEPGLLRRFHEQLVETCGNDTLATVVGTLEALWSSHVGSSTARATHHADHRSANELDKSIQDHAEILDRISAGDPEGTHTAVTRHIDRVQHAPSPANVDRPLDITTLQWLYQSHQHQ